MIANSHEPLHFETGFVYLVRYKRGGRELSQRRIVTAEQKAWVQKPSGVAYFPSGIARATSPSIRRI